MNFDEAPLLVFWETTRACELACRHCRAEAMPEPSPDELTTSEGCRLIEQLAHFGPRPPVLVMTGGDVMSRSDLLELVAAARRAGLPVALAPSVTPRLKMGPLEELRGLGVSSVSLSLDGATAATHEGIRGVPGHFAETVSALHHLRSLGFKVQVNTAVMVANVDELAALAAIVKDVGAASWEVFFLVHVGRGRDQQELSPADNEDVAHLLFEASHYGFAVRTVEGPWCRRVAAWRQGTPLTATPASAFRLGPLYRRQSPLLRELLGPPTGPPQMASAGTRDGKGILLRGPRRLGVPGRVPPAAPRQRQGRGPGQHLPAPSLAAGGPGGRVRRAVWPLRVQGRLRRLPRPGFCGQRETPWPKTRPAPTSPPDGRWDKRQPRAVSAKSHARTWPGSNRRTTSSGADSAYASPAARPRYLTAMRLTVPVTPTCVRVTRVVSSTPR